MDQLLLGDQPLAVLAYKLLRLLLEEDQLLLAHTYLLIRLVVLDSMLSMIITILISPDSVNCFILYHISSYLSFFSEENTTTLRVTNLSDETSENDLSEMFRDFGNVSRVYLVRDKETNQSRGFAFVTFQSRRYVPENEDRMKGVERKIDILDSNFCGNAEAAMNKLNGTGWDHLILSIEWAKPSVK